MTPTRTAQIVMGIVFGLAAVGLFAAVALLLTATGVC